MSYKIFVSSGDEQDLFEYKEHLEEELEMMNGAMNKDDSFVILKDGKFYCKGKFNKEKYKLRILGKPNLSKRSKA